MLAPYHIGLCLILHKDLISLSVILDLGLVLVVFDCWLSRLEGFSSFARCTYLLKSLLGGYSSLASSIFVGFESSLKGYSNLVIGTGGKPLNCKNPISS